MTKIINDFKRKYQAGGNFKAPSKAFEKSSLTSQEQDINKFLKKYPTKYNRTEKNITPQDYAQYTKLMQTASGDDVVDFLFKKGYITLKTNPKKFQNPSGPIYFSTNYGTIDPYALRENPYKIIKKGAPGLTYDAINAGLYLAAPFTGGTTTIPAMLMSGAKGAGAVADMVENNIDPHNFIDAVSTVPIMSFGPMVSNAAKNAKIMRQFGKALTPKTTIQPTKVITQKVVSKYPPYIYRGQVLQHPGFRPEIMYNSYTNAAKPFFKEASRLSKDAMVGTGVQELMYTPVIAADMIDESK